MRWQVEPVVFVGVPQCVPLCWPGGLKVTKVLNKTFVDI